jgi:hypothetical protein
VRRRRGIWSAGVCIVATGEASRQATVVSATRHHDPKTVDDEKAI